MQKLTTKANRFDHLVNAVQEEGTTWVLLEMFKDDILRQALVERLLNSAEVQDSGQLYPRAFQFNLLSEFSQSNMVHVMPAIAIGATKKLLPKDAEQGASAQLKRMTEEATFERYALPNLVDGNKSEESYLQFTKTPVVQAIKTSMGTLGTQDQKLRLKLASLLAMYPHDWITQYIDKLGRATMRNAKDHAKALGPGLRPEFETPVERNRRYGPKEKFLSLWLE
jgi:hypothetical protein